jgi:hypothetical protein
LDKGWAFSKDKLGNQEEAACCFYNFGGEK